MPDIQLCGDDLVSIALENCTDATSLASALRHELAAIEVVPGVDSVVVQFDAANEDSDAVVRQIDAVLAAGLDSAAIADSLIEIPVHYGGEHGPDLEAVCAMTGLTADELIAEHTSRSYPVELIGFTPGFAFVGGLDERLNVPRRSEPRQRLAAGSLQTMNSLSPYYLTRLVSYIDTLFWLEQAERGAVD